MPVSRLLMDRELSRALDGVPMTPNGAFDLTDIPATRAAFRAQAEPTAASEPDDPSVITQEYRVSRADGPDVPVRLLRPATVPGPLPVMLWFHGGGQVLGFAAQDDAWLKPLCSQLACAVAVVDYRLAPETPSPGAAEDGFTAYQWLVREAQDLGLDSARIGIAGQSGGGGIAAATVLLLRDRGGAAPLFQSLTYPMLDDRNLTASSHEITDIGIWDRSTNILAWQAILGAAPEPTTSPPTPPPPARRTSARCRRPSSRSANSTASATRTSTTPRACAPTGSRSNCTSTRAPTTPSTCSPPSRGSRPPSSRPGSTTSPAGSRTHPPRDVLRPARMPVQALTEVLGRSRTARVAATSTKDAAARQARRHPLEEAKERNTMPIINIDAWEGAGDEQTQELLTEVTETVHRVTNIPRDKILVLFHANPVKYWAQGGVLASDPDFLEKSRQH